MSRTPKVLNTYLRGLKRLTTLANEVELLEEDVAFREAGALTKILAQLEPLLPRLARPIPLHEPWHGPDPKKVFRAEGLVVLRSFQNQSDGGVLRHTGDRLVVLAEGQVVRLKTVGSWREGPPVSETSWHVEAVACELTPEFARRHLRSILVGILDVLKEALARGRGERETLKQRLTLLKEVDELLAVPEA